MATSESAILVGIELKSSRAAAQGPETSAADSLEELAVLAESAGATVLARHLQVRDSPEAATLVGSGKVKELAEQAEAFDASLILFDRDLTPTQLRNLEKALPCKVLDRTQLILDIFARRARTREGQLQVELAQLSYLLPRLTGRGVAMSRLGGGIGTRGPGETKLETDRRRINQRIKRLSDTLENVRSHRGVQRQQRQAVPLATVALVGYTNAGKSTLFNRLTSAGVLADARMFATLDPTVRHITLPSHRRALLSDTVGFIRNLPTTLVKAFRATLEETVEASLLLHLVDCSSPQALEHAAHVLEVLREIGASATTQILVLTKTDLLGPGEDPMALARRVGDGASHAVAVSAKSGAGVDALLARIDELLPLDRVSKAWFRFPASEGAARHILFEYARVIEEEWVEDECLIQADVPDSVRDRLQAFLTTRHLPASARR